jgi:hypothetical protein
VRPLVSRSPALVGASVTGHAGAIDEAAEADSFVAQRSAEVPDRGSGGPRALAAALLPDEPPRNDDAGPRTQRSPATWSSSAPSPVAPPNQSARWSQPITQRTGTSESALPGRTQSPRVAASAVAAGPREALPLAQRRAASAAHQAADATEPGAINADRSTPRAWTVGETPTVEREIAVPTSAEAFDPVFGDGPDPAASVQRAPAEAASGGDAPAAGGAGGGGGIPTGDRELDDLAHRLYDRLRSRLRLELLIDRERSGTLSDLT